MLMELEQEQATRLSSGKVLRQAGNRIQLQIGDVSVWARMALAYPYQAAVGDTLLAIGQEEDWYVIGVLQGAGTTTLTVPGDLHIDAPRGAIELTAAKGIRLRSSGVQIVSEKLELAARTVVERFVNAARWVKNACQLRAGRIRTLVKGEYRLKGRRIHECAEEEVRIDGKKINLG